MHMLQPGKDTGTIRSDIFVYHLKYSGVYASVYILNYRLLLSIKNYKKQIHIVGFHTTHCGKM